MFNISAHSSFSAEFLLQDRSSSWVQNCCKEECKSMSVVNRRKIAIFYTLDVGEEHGTVSTITKQKMVPRALGILGPKELCSLVKT